MEKKLITFEGFVPYCLAWLESNCRDSENEIGLCLKEHCPLWKSLESPEPKVTIVPATGTTRRNGWV